MVTDLLVPVAVDAYVGVVVGAVCAEEPVLCLCRDNKMTVTCTKSRIQSRKLTSLQILFKEIGHFTI